MNAPRYVIRLFKGGIENWLAEHAPSEQLAKLFDLKEPEQSVYEVADGEEEWLTAAAYVLTTPKQGVEPVSLLRIREEDLGRFGITVDRDQPGTTGVVWVDHRHRNLCTNRERLIELVGSVAEECRRGHDRVRRVSKEHVTRSLRRICDYPAPTCPPHVKSVARWALKETEKPTLDLSQVYEELCAVEFDDEIIRPRAQVKGGADAVANWFASLSELRRLYAEHYLPAVAGRFGLHWPHPPGP